MMKNAITSVTIAPVITSMREYGYSLIVTPFSTIADWM